APISRSGPSPATATCGAATSAASATACRGDDHHPSLLSRGLSPGLLGIGGRQHFFLCAKTERTDRAVEAGIKCRNDSRGVVKAGLSSMKRINSEGAIPRLGIITGLASEAVVATALIGDNGFPARIVCAGASNERAAALAQE